MVSVQSAVVWFGMVVVRKSVHEWVGYIRQLFRDKCVLRHGCLFASMQQGYISDPVRLLGRPPKQSIEAGHNNLCINKQRWSTLDESMSANRRLVTLCMSANLRYVRSFWDDGFLLELSAYSICYVCWVTALLHVVLTA